MKRILRTFAAISLAAAVLASSAHAQDGSEGGAARTPEAAQAFLSDFLQRGGWVAQAYNWFDGSTFTYLGPSGWQTASTRADTSALTGVQADVTGVEMVNPCTTRVTATASHARRVVYEDPDVPVQSKALTFLIDWKAVDPVKVRDEFFASRTGHEIYHGYRLDLSDPKTKNSIMFYVEDKTKADRAAFALSFLQEHCDPAAGSGF